MQVLREIFMADNPYKQSQAVLRNAGIFSEPADHRVISGYDTAGRPVYMSKELAKANDPTLGARFSQVMYDVLDPTGAFKEGSDKTNWQKIGAVASNAQTIIDLNNARKSGDSKGFINIVANQFNLPLQNQMSSQKGKGGVGTAFASYNLFQNWDRMSVGQKSLGLASLGIQSYKFGTGEDLSSKILAGGKNGVPALSVGDTLNYVSQGMSAYDLTQNWDQYSTVEKVVKGGRTAVDVASLAKKYFFTNTAKQEGEKFLANSLSSKIAEKGAQQAATNTAKTSVGSALGTFADVATPILGAYATYEGVKNIYEGWGQNRGNKLKGAVGGAVAGASVAGGLSAMGMALGPIGIAGIIAVGIAGSVVKNRQA
jgi:hypothetical protein